jgi:hypothetical protein
MELQPESDAQPAIRPTQFILHSIVAPWTPERTYEYWRDSTNLESHFGLGYDGSLGQFIGTETRADANAAANRRADGTGAVSLESASNLQASDPWTAAQVETLIRLGAWLHEEHGIPLRICRSADGPGFGYHRLFTSWNPNGHSCPGDARVTQFKNVVFPGIVARATGKTTPQETDMTPDQATQLKTLHDNLLSISSLTEKDAKGNPVVHGAGYYLAHIHYDALKIVATEAAQTAALTALATAIGKVDAAIDVPALVAEVKAAIDAAVSQVVIHLDIPDAA